MMIDANIAPYARQAWPRLAGTAAITLLASGASIGAAFAMAAAFTHILTTGGTLPIGALTAAVALLLLRALLLWSRDLSALHTGTVIARTIRERLLRHIVALGPGHRWPGGRASAHLAAVDGCEHLKGYLGNYLPQALAAVLVPATLTIVLFVRDPAVAVVVIIAVATVPLAHRITKRLLGERAAAHWQAYDRYAARVSDNIAGIATLAGFGAAERRGDRLARDAETLRAATTANMNVSLSTYVLTSAAMLLGTSGATLLAAWHAAEGRLSPGDVLLVLFLAAECFRPLQDLQNYWHEGFYGLAAAGSINRILATEPQVTSAPDAVPVDLAGPPGLRLREVSFTYPGTDRPSLEKVTATIPAGRTTALVGASGAGKTTLTALLLRDADPDNGSVELTTETGSHDLRRIPLDQVRQISARVSQDVVLMEGTVEENVRLAAPESATEGQVHAALDTAQVTPFLAELPAGPQSNVGEGGTNLSGGQRQRVALARALVQGAPLLVLDEATSALDGENEALISAAVRSSDRSRTTVVIAHRLSTVAQADHVIVLGEGRVLEEGSPAELETRPEGAWTAMVRAQRIADGGPREVVS
ncbi:ABC transporter ATP-binding protein/permease [Ruania halotolerans]|uniref:ABC transporter ATP-binding protein/permease n=1 Tax=Ruania halotolerans TaxID=2897773 RepID=UPI001E323203|nr:ABC transporter ATP-binding protein [Ruania halotolerans]UFU06461.1 ABC transporter ATP-binding protein/permease [Ruania halotolerans]